MRPLKDDDLLTLIGATVTSTRLAGVSYGVESVLGQGAHGVLFLATRRLAGSEVPVVLKLLRPRAIRDLAGRAGTAVEKEVSALARLSEKFPPTPHVVRMLDTGVLRLNESALELPWLAIEYVHGGAEGNTLQARVDNALSHTGRGFDCTRAWRVARAMVAGLTAIHELGLVHRDIAPGNVLAAGVGNDELYKIADFGLARVENAATFGNVMLGTPGYCAPEQSFPDKVGVGPYTDVFGLACSVYFALTGEHYFGAMTIPETLVAAHATERPSLHAARGLCAELRDDPDACAAIDRVLAHATHADPRQRTASARDLGAVLLPLLARAARVEMAKIHGASPALSAVAPSSTQARDLGSSPRAADANLRLVVLRRPGGVARLDSVSWDSDGHFLAATPKGLEYWDGWNLRAVPWVETWLPRLVHRTGLRRWLLVGDGGFVADFDEGRIARSVATGPTQALAALAGAADGSFALVARRPEGPFELRSGDANGAVVSHALGELTAVAGLVEHGAGGWLVAGRNATGLDVLSVLDSEHSAVRSLGPLPHQVLACAGDTERRVVLCAGPAGRITRLVREQISPMDLPVDAPVTAAAVAPGGRAWAATPGALWRHDNGWTRAWTDASFTSPFISMTTSGEHVAAVTAEGGIVRGEWY